MAQWVKTIATEPDDLSLIPRTHWRKVIIDSSKLFFDLYHSTRISSTNKQQFKLSKCENITVPNQSLLFLWRKVLTQMMPQTNCGATDSDMQALIPISSSFLQCIEFPDSSICSLCTHDHAILWLNLYAGLYFSNRSGQTTDSDLPSSLCSPTSLIISYTDHFWILPNLDLSSELHT